LSLNLPRFIQTKTKPLIEPPIDVEDEARISNINFYKNSKLKLCLFYFLCLITLGMIALITKWSLTWRLKLKYKACRFGHAKIVVVKGEGKRYYYRIS